MIWIQADTLRAFSARLLEAAGTPHDIAEVVARILVTADLKGHTSHGVNKISGHLQQMEQGTLIPDARPEILRETPSTALVDARQGWGYYAAQWCMSLAIEKARATGVGAVSLPRTHIGRLGEYVEQAVAGGFIGMVMAGGGGLGTAQWRGAAAPFGGAAKALGTNPIAVGVPSGDGRPFIADFATTMSAGAKIGVFRMKGLELPPGWIVDKDGRPSVDPNDFFDGGSLLVFGRYKGYAFSLMACLLGELSGAGPAGTGREACHVGGQLFQAIDVRAFQPLEEYEQGVSSFLDGIRSILSAPGFSEVMVPGDSERRTEEKQSREGIELLEVIWKRLLECGEKYGLELE